jgi:hypothetical protein
MVETDTVAKLLHQWDHPHGPPVERYRLRVGTTVLVDEAGMVGTATLGRLVDLAHRQRWRLVLVGDPRQLAAVGRGGLFAELCTTGRVHELARIHRFGEPWEAAASLQLRAGRVTVLKAYQAHDRITPGPLDEHLHQLAHAWFTHTAAGRTVAVMAATNDHVDRINDAIHRVRIRAGQLDEATAVPIAGGERACRREIVVTRRNERQLLTSAGEPVRNRDQWTVAATHGDGSLTVTRSAGHGTILLPAWYVSEHVRLGYAATVHGTQGDTVDVALTLVSNATTHPGLYVAMTRGRDHNHMHVITDTREPAEAHDVVEAALVRQRSDVPAVTQRRRLAIDDQTPRPHRPEPVSIVPGWVAAWRHELEQDADELVVRLAVRVQQQATAAVRLAELQPLLDAARAAWQPYADRVVTLDRELRDVLRPAAWRADQAARTARFGHRHGATCRADAAHTAVAHAEARVAAIKIESAPVKERYDEVQLELRHAYEQSRRSTGDGLRSQLDEINGVLDAIDTWIAWASGRPVAVTALARAADTLTAIGDRAPTGVTDRGEVDRTTWTDALRPVRDALTDDGVAVSRDLGPWPERALGLELEL